jgi:hypothetical protein
MSIKIGDIDVVQEIIELRHQLIRTQMILELLINKNQDSLELLTEDEMKELEDKAVTQLITQYPNNVSKK